jgi:hypothetical protein
VSETTPRRYAQMDGPVRGILGAGLVLAAVVLLSLGLLQWLFNVFERRAELGDVPRHALAEDRVVPPEPRLLEDPDGHYATWAAEQRETLATPAWIDRDAGLVRVPVERALELVLEEGLPHR